MVVHVAGAVELLDADLGDVDEGTEFGVVGEVEVLDVGLAVGVGVYAVDGHGGLLIVWLCWQGTSPVGGMPQCHRFYS